jgi:hypothetical protein
VCSSWSVELVGCHRGFAKSDRQPDVWYIGLWPQYINISITILDIRSRSYFTTYGQLVSVYLGIEHPCGTCDQILLPVGMLLYEICGLISVGRPLWREDGSPICSVITQWSESFRTRNHTLPSHLRLPQPGEPGSRIYISQEQGGPVILPGTGFPLRRRLAGLRWRNSNPPPTWRDRPPYIYTSGIGWFSPKPNVKVTLRPTASQSVCLDA